MRALFETMAVFGAVSALTACGQSERDFYAEPPPTASPTANTDNTTAATTSGMSTGAGNTSGTSGGGGGMEGQASASTAGAGGSSSTTSDSTGSSGTASGTTGHPNDPECPGQAPEATSACRGMVGLTCSYGETTCVCSGLTWNCVGGSEVSSGTTAGSTGSPATTAQSSGASATTSGSEVPFR